MKYIGAPLLTLMLVTACAGQSAPVAPATPTTIVHTPTLAPIQESTLTPTQTPVAVPTENIATVAPADPPTTSPSPVAATSAPTQDKCVGEVRFLAVVNFPDGAHVAPGQTISKQWRIRNESNCPLGLGYEWHYLNDAAGTRIDFGYPVLVMPQDIAPHSDYDLSATLVMPNEPGEYEGSWQLVTPSGMTLDEIIRLRVIVSAPG